MSLFSIFEPFFDLRQDLCARTHSIMLKNPTHQYDSWDSLSFNDANISKIIDNGKLKHNYCLKQRLFLTYIKSHHLVVLFLLYNISQCLPSQLSNLVGNIYITKKGETTYLKLFHLKNFESLKKYENNVLRRLVSNQR